MMAIIKTTLKSHRTALPAVGPEKRRTPAVTAITTAVIASPKSPIQFPLKT